MNRQLIFLIVILLLLTPAPARAQIITIEVETSTANLELPEKLVFSLSVRSQEPLKRISLVYGSNARSCQTSSARREVTFEPGDPVLAEWEWDFMRNGSLPPGAEIWWQWEIQDEAGTILLTEKQTISIEDQRYEWQSLQDDQLSVFWVEGDAKFGRAMLQEMQGSLAQLENNAGIHPALPVRLTIYPSTNAMLDALIDLPVWSGGVAFPEYGSIVTGLTPDEMTFAYELIPHELAHLITDELVFNCLGVSIPTWLSEGLAVYAEGIPKQSDLDWIQHALENGNLPSLRSLSESFSPNPTEAVHAYAQSGEVVRYLIDTFGPDYMAALLETFRSGKTTDKALLATYGFDTDGLDAAWRTEQGFGPESSPQPDKSAPAPSATTIPTLAIWTSVVQQTTDTPTGSPTSKPTSTPQPSSTTVLSTPSSTAAPLPTPTEASKPGLAMPCGSPLIGLLGAAILVVRVRSLRSAW